MRITILSYGSRGDVQPFVALGVGLKKAGYRVRLAVPHRFEEFVESHGLEFAPLVGDPSELSRLFVDRAGSSPFKTMQVMWSFALPLAKEVALAMEAACEDADAVIHNFLMSVSGHSLAEEYGIPEIATNLFPVFYPTGEFPAPVLARSQSKIINRLSHRFFANSFWVGMKFSGNWILRRQLPDMPKIKTWPADPKLDPPVPMLYGISPSVLPKPADWPSHAQMTGYWFLDAPQDYHPPEDLHRFLEAGPPPVFLGFGSMITEEKGHLMDTILAGIELSGQRAVLQSGWLGLGAENLPEDIFLAGDLPYDWLFPQMAAIVHHGGAGTTGTALKSGVPSFVVPFAADQPFWGNIVHGLGVGPEPVHMRKLTPQNLAAGIQQAVTDAEMRRAAAKLGARIQAEDGVGEAVRFIRGYFGKAE
jgi:UDP:flavonoid glycosyltransferase YjiC (YdhE family)